MIDFMLGGMVRRLLGISALILIGFLFSNEKKKIDWMHIVMKLGMLLAGAFVFLKVEIAINAISYMAGFFINIYNIAGVGTEFLFGSLSDMCGPCGFIFAIKILPVIIFFSSLVSILYYYGIIQKVVELLGKVLQPVLGTTGAETLNAVANTFLGQTEAPLLIRNYLKSMNESEIFAVMVSGMGTISCGLFAVYGAFGIPIEHLLISSILSIPATLLIAKLWYPNASNKKEKASINFKSPHNNVIDALSSGAIDGLSLALNIGAILMVITSLLFMVNNLLEWVSSFFLSCEYTLSLEMIFSYVMLPFSWLLGIVKCDILPAAALIGIKTIVNEMVAYTRMATLCLDSSTVVILTYALCGFANLSSIGIQVGAIGTLEPSVRGTLSKLGLKAVFAALCANLLIACVVGLFL